MAPTQNSTSAADEHREPTEISYELEDALWRAGPLDAPLVSGRHYPPRSMVRPQSLTTDAMRWLADAVRYDRWKTDDADRMLTQVLALTTQESPNLAYGPEGRPALVYRGHLTYRGQIYVSPGLFFPACDHVVVRVDAPFVMVTEHGEWIAGALRPATVSAFGMEQWLGAAWGWLTELRKTELGDLYDPAKESIDSFGYLVAHRYDFWGATCNA